MGTLDAALLKEQTFAIIFWALLIGLALRDITALQDWAAKSTLINSGHFMVHEWFTLTDLPVSTFPQKHDYQSIS